MKSLFLTLLFLAAACDSSPPTAPTAKGCVEFDHVTARNGEPVKCRMIWCEKSVMSTSIDVHPTGGVAVLWCDPVKKDGSP